MKMSMKTLLVLFIGALIPLSTAWAASVNSTTTNTTETINQTQTLPVNATNMTNTTPVNMTNVTNTTNTSVMAYNLLVILDKVANYTESLITKLNASNVTISNHTLDLYSQAETMHTKAWELYNAGNYSESINASMNALYLYKEVIEELTDYYEEHKEEKMEEQYEYYELIMDAKEELQRASEYFPYVEKVIAEAEAEGLNVTQIKELYNATKEAYKVVAQDLASGNITALKANLEYAEELMDRLEDAVEKLQEQLVSAKADEISQAFMEKLQEQMKVMNELLTMLGNSTINATYLQEDLMELQMMYEEFNALVESGQYEEALDMLHDINEELKDIVEEVKELQEEYYEKEHDEHDEYEEHMDENESEHEDDHEEHDEKYAEDESEDNPNESYEEQSDNDDGNNGEYEEQESHDEDNGQHEDSEDHSSEEKHEDENDSEDEE